MSPNGRPLTEAQLLGLLGELAGGDETKRDAAAASLREAVQEYRRQIPPNLSHSRKSLKKLSLLLDAVMAQVKGMPFDALREFLQHYDAPRGRLVKEVDRAAQAASASLEGLSRVAPKRTDHAAYVLAWKVAHIFVYVLELTPASTPDDAVNINSTQGGAAYARVLRGALRMAGKPNVDIRRLVDAGLRMLRDPNSPSL